MSTIIVNLEADIAALLQATNQPLEQAAREFIILELYRRGAISSGRAAELLGMSRSEFIHYTSRLGIAFFDMTDDKWQAERSSAQSL
jgi:predicted HTH domain antitoxin